MANPSAPREGNDTTGAKIWAGITNVGGTPTAALVRIINAALVNAETTISGAWAVAAQTLHDAADPAAEGPVKIGLYAKAAAPTDVSADGDRVNAWGLRNGAQVVNLSAAGALIPGDATNGLRTYSAPATSGGLSTFNGTSSDGGTALTGTAQVIKASAGQVFGWAMHNPNDETCYVNFYNTAAGSVTVGTTNPLFQYPIPAGASANMIGALGIEFTNAGFSISATKTAGSATNPDTALEVVVFYK